MLSFLEAPKGSIKRMGYHRAKLLMNWMEEKVSFWSIGLQSVCLKIVGGLASKKLR
jgi:hypothetical protein